MKKLGNQPLTRLARITFGLVRGHVPGPRYSTRPGLNASLRRIEPIYNGRMRMLFSTASAGLLIFGFAAMAPAQAPRKSPHESTSIDVGGHKITVTYGRPYLKGRKMLGAHEPYGKVWRTGADEATTLETGADLDINGLRVPKGKYGLFTIPGEHGWKLIVSKKPDQWGAFTYSEADDLGRVDMTAGKSSGLVEQFTIKLTPAGGNGVTLAMSWENTEVTVPIKVAP
jgi:hypothetical protein